MARNVINILVGIELSKNAELFRKTLKMHLESFDEITIGKIDLVHDKEEIERAVASGQYDVFVCKEIVGERTYGGGSIDSWRKANSNIRILLVVDEEKRGGTKLYRLYSRGYYDAIYNSDFTNPAVFVNLILHGRTLEQAFKYYGVADNDEYQAQQRSDMENYEEPVLDELGEAPDAELNEDSQEESVDDDFDEDSQEEPVDDDFDEDSQEEPVDDDFDEESIDIEELLRSEPVPKPADVQKGEREKSARSQGVEKEGKKKQLRKEASEQALVAQSKLAQREASADKKESNGLAMSKRGAVQILRADVVDVVPEPSIETHTGYIVTTLTDTAIVIEIPKGKFLKRKDMIAGMPITLITPPLIDSVEEE